MNYISIENVPRNAASENEVAEIFSFDPFNEKPYESVLIDEFGYYRIVSNIKSISSITIGEIELNKIEFQDSEDQYIYFFTNDDTDDKNYLPNSSRLGMNLSGKTILTIEIENTQIEILLEINSVKVTPEELSQWYSLVHKKFPIYSDYITLPITFSDASWEKNINNTSFNNIIKETENFVSRINHSINNNKYLKYFYHRKKDNELYKDIFNISNKNQWFKRNNQWKKVALNSSSVVRKGIYCFEPTRFPAPNIEKNYNTDLNIELSYNIQLLFNYIELIEEKLLEQLPKIDSIPTGYRGEQYLQKLQYSYASQLSKLKENIKYLLFKLNNLGIINTSSRKYIFDKRFVELNQDIQTIKYFTDFFKKLDTEGNLKKGTISTDKIFEYFAYSKIVDILEKKFDFVVEDSGFDFPVNFFVEMNKKTQQPTEKNVSYKLWSLDEIGLRIFFDHPVIKDIRNKKTKPPFPFSDTLKDGVEKRPDFIIHIYKKNFEAIVILDAKFSHGRAFSKKFSSAWMDGDNLLGKYGTKMFQTSGQYLPAIFLGALKVPEKDFKDETIFKSLLTENASVNGKYPSIQQIGYADIHSKCDKGINALFENIFIHFDNLERMLPEYNREPLKAPKKYKETKYKYSKKQNILTDPHKTPNLQQSKLPPPKLTNKDAAIIKGETL